MEANRLFTELYRPKKLENVILLDRIRQKLGDGLIKQNICLTTASPGTGKTSLVKILTKDYVTKYINASKDRGIDVVRDVIEPFLMTKPLIQKENPLKVIWLEEAHHGSESFYKSLFSLIEQYAESARFIMTCNYINKIPKPLLSRFNVIDLAPKNKEEEDELFKKIRKRILAISKKYELTWNADVLNTFVKENFPDIRKMTSKVQDFVDSGITSVDDISDLDKVSDFSEIFETIINSSTTPEQVFQLVRGKYAGKGNDVFHSLAHDFPEWVRNKNRKEYLNIMPQSFISVADWAFKATTTSDFDTNVIACIFQCNNLFKQVKK